MCQLLQVISIIVCLYTCTAGEAEEDGYDDEYQLEDLEVTPADYVKPILVANFRKTW